jgi:ribosomal protein S18 acetylase RimI-like enzyme
VADAYNRAMSDWTIGRAAPGEWERVRRVRLRALADTPDAFGTTLAQDEARPDDQWRARLADSHAATFVASAGGEDVGLVTGRPYEEVAGSAGLFGMWVAPSQRGRGIAGELVDAVVAWARASRFERVLLDVADANAAAIALYASKGFEPTGVTGSLPAPREHVAEHQRSLEL